MMVASPLLSNDNATAIDAIIDTLGNVSNGLVVSGEPGLGKEAIVRMLYARSPFRGYPFVKVNCPMLSVNAQDEDTPCMGDAMPHPKYSNFSLFRLFHQGVLYLHAVDELTAPLQDRLLALIKRKLMPAATSSIGMPGRIMIFSTATLSLDACTAAGCFNPLLAELLSGVSMHIPPLRHNPNRINQLVKYFINHLAAAEGRGNPVQPSIAHLTRLCAHDWPGNMKELQDTVGRAIRLNDWTAAIDQLDEGDDKAHDGATLNLTSDGVALMPDFEITQRRMLERLSERVPTEEVGLMDLLIYEELTAGNKMH
jgi:DNA-binding NtrC family response regulator